MKAGKLILIALNLLAFSPKIDRLAQEEALNASVRNVGADLERGAPRKAGDSFGIAKTKSLIEFRIDPDFCTLPQFGANKIHEIQALAPLVRREALRTQIG